MAPSAQEHARQRQQLLFQKLLNQRDGASPLTLVLDSLEQPAAPIITEFAIRAKVGSVSYVLLIRHFPLTGVVLFRCPESREGQDYPRRVWDPEEASSCRCACEHQEQDSRRREG